MEEFAADLIIINPLTGYLGVDTKDEAGDNKFLREWLAPVIDRHKCGCLIIHHWPKTNFKKNDDYSWFDWMYSMAGSAALTNWPRAVLVIAPTEIPGTYRFIAAKRFDEIGWQEREYWFSHSREDDIILWVPASQDEIASAKKASALTPDDILCHVPKLDPISQEKFFQRCKEKSRLGVNTARRYINILIDEKKAYVWKLPRPGKKAALGYSQSKPSADDEEP